jgi:hypothetical protein
MSGAKVIVSPVPYAVVHDTEEYPTEKIEIELANDTLRKRTVKVWSAKRGIEGLLYCYDAVKKQCMDKFTFDIDNIEEYFPAMLDTEAERRWTAVWSSVPTAEKNVARFELEFSNFVTIVSGSANPRDDLVEYITHSDECKKKRNVDVDVHVSRIITLCLLANRLQGAQSALTDDQITLAIFHSFPDSWQSHFRLHRGRSTNFTREEIVAYFRDKKSFEDGNEQENKSKRKNKVANLQAFPSSVCWNNVPSVLVLRPLAIHKPMQFVNACIKQWVMFCVPSCMESQLLPRRHLKSSIMR